MSLDIYYIKNITAIHTDRSRRGLPHRGLYIYIYTPQNVEFPLPRTHSQTHKHTQTHTHISYLVLAALSLELFLEPGDLHLIAELQFIPTSFSLG